MRHPDCDCPRAVHEHGSRTTYVVHRCRCAECTAANRVAARARSKAKAFGRYDKFVDGDQVRAHLRTLMAQGMGWKRIARAAGVACSTVYAILYGKHLDDPSHPEHRPPRKQVQRDVAERLLAVELGLAGGVRVDATGTNRRLQALVAIGWPCSELARRLGIRPNNFRPEQDRVNKSTADAVLALYDELWDQPRSGGFAERARRMARRRGWAPPMAWDDDLIDDPEARPEDCKRVSESRAITADDLRWLVDQVDSWEELSLRSGLAVNTAYQYCRRYGIEAPQRFEVAAEIQRMYRYSARRGGAAA